MLLVISDVKQFSFQPVRLKVLSSLTSLQLSGDNADTVRTKFHNVTVPELLRDLTTSHSCCKVGFMHLPSTSDGQQLVRCRPLAIRRRNIRKCNGNSFHNSNVVASSGDWSTSASSFSIYFLLDFYTSIYSLELPVVLEQGSGRL